MPFTFKVGESIKKAWKLYKENFSQMMILTLIMLVVQILSQSFSKNGHNNTLLSFILAIVSIFVSYIWIKYILNLLEGKDSNPFSKEALPSFAQIWDFFKTSILTALCVIPTLIPFAVLFIGAVVMSTVVGAHINILLLIILIPLFILLILPGIYVSSRLFPAKYLSIGKCQGARKSIKESWNMTKGNGWKITWKIILVGLFILLGFFALFVGMIITLPLGMIVLTMMYRELTKFGGVTEIVATPVIPVTPITPVVGEVSEAPVEEEIK